MLIARVELHSAITGEVTELARMDICNEGGTVARGDYGGYVMRGRNREALNRRSILKQAKISGYPRQALHVWNLVTRMLNTLGYK